ncbi:hypothetical protein CALK_0447 [Chitinivibrio alkaliphilus ACht1]|uniref:Uncharacterized protein n=2 Tax=Chitinivibrio TaxID=1505231 RepID=U7DBL0_9BACT|nr:hypothetical protein CALK_0447 [Chitinivibrio alkaliphilus ACht1]
MNPIDQNLGGTYLFFSFDLVNSTAFKLQDPHWPPLFNQFFDYCRLKTKAYFPQCRDWKMVGDEILFYLPLRDEELLHDAPQKVYAILQKSVAFVNTHSTTAGVLSVKSVMWAARMREQRDFNSTTREENYLIKNVKRGEITLDFLGPHIDIGFRLATFAYQGKLVVGASLAALLLRQKENALCADNMKIVSYEPLKGVWQGRRYPIVWYHEEWNRLDKMFLYDEQFTSPLAQKILCHDIPQKNNIADLEKVFSDLHKTDELTQLAEGIAEYRNNNPQESDFSLSLERLSELHLVALCINEDNQLLIGKNIQEAKWDFGCSSLQLYKSIEQSLEEGYRDDFGISLVPLHGEYPPVATYSFSMDREQKTIPGVMFLARVQKNAVSQEKLDPFTYETYRWIQRSEIYDISPQKAVPGFHRRAEKAFAEYERIQKSTSPHIKYPKEVL